MDAQVLGQVGLLAEPLAALRTRVGPRLDVDATVLEQGALLFELLLADRTAHVQWHPGGPTVLDHVRHGLTVGRWFVVQVGQIVTKDRVVDATALGVFEVRWILEAAFGREAGS